MTSGRSMGRAEVVCSRQTDAEAAMKKYNNFKFRGRYMKVKIVGRFYNRRFSNHATYRPVPYAPPKIQAPDAVRGHGLIADQAAPSTTSSAIETEAKLFISHLDHEISYKDIEKHFSKTGQLLRYSLHYERTGQSRVGELKECLLNYDKHGRPRGTAEVVYSRRCDALKAVGSYNNYPLRGWPVKIDIVDANVKALVDLLGPVAGSTGNTDWASNFGRGRGGVVRQGGWRHGFGRERGRSKKRYRSEEVSAEELDADLDRYTSKAMPRLK